MLDVNELRARVLAGEPYTTEELRHALASLRTVRTEAATKTVATRKAKADAKVPLSDADLDASLAQFGLDL